MAARTESASGTGEWLRGFWGYYRGYTKTSVHAAATASLTALGLLIFIDPLFAWVAIASYVFPPVALYVIGGGHDPNPAGDGTDTDPSETAVGTGEPTDPIIDANQPVIGAGVGTDADVDGIDLDFDADADVDGQDADADGPDMDVDGADADADGVDTDADGADADADGPDRDSD